LRKLRNNIRNLSKGTRQDLAGASSFMSGLGSMAAAATAAMAGMALHQRGKTESALGDLATMGIKKLGVLEKAARHFSNRWANVTTPEFLDAAYKIKGSYADLSDEMLATVSRVALITARGLKAMPDEVAKFYGRVFNIHRNSYLKMSDLDFAKMVSGGVAAAYKNFNVTGSTMATAMEKLGAAANKWKVPLEEQIAVLGMLQNQMGAEEAGTAYKALMANLVKAQQKFKISLVDTAGKAKSLPEILATLERAINKTGVDKGQALQYIADSFGSEEAAKVIDQLIDKHKKLRDNIEKVKDSLGKGLAPTYEQALQRNKGWAEVTAITAQLLANLADVVGKALAPGLKAVQHTLAPIIEGMQEWADANPGLVRQIVAVGIALGGLIAILGAAAAATFLFNAAVWTNPITWIVAGIVAGIVALVAGLAWLWANWDKVTKWAKAAWESLLDFIIDIGTRLFLPWILAGIFLYRAWKQLWEWLEEPLTDFATWLGETWTALWTHIVTSMSQFGRLLWAALKEVAGGLLELFFPEPFREAGANLARGIWDGIKSIWSELRDWVGSAVNELIQWMPEWLRNRLGVNGVAIKGGQYDIDPPASSVQRAARGLPAAAGQQRLNGDINLRVKSDRPVEVERLNKSGNTGVDLNVGLTYVGVPY